MPQRLHRIELGRRTSSIAAMNSIFRTAEVLFDPAPGEFVGRQAGAAAGVEAAAARRGSSSVPFDGVLGMNVLSKYLVVIDGPEGVLYLAEQASTAE
jgi:hypothetical protein